jgi:cysteine-rich repeat protein
MPRLVMTARLLVLLGWVYASGVQAVAPPFEPPVPLSPSAMTDNPVDLVSNPAAATDGSGTWVVAWTSIGTIGSDADILFARSTDGGLTFSAEAPLNTDAATDTEESIVGTTGLWDDSPAIAAHGNRFIAVWHRQSIFTTTIQIARSDDAGVTWTAPEILFDRSYDPTIATDGAGTWIIAWAYRPQVGVADRDLYFTRSVDDGATWSVPAALNGNAGAGSMLGFPMKMMFSGGVWVAAWTAPGFASSNAVYARSIDGGASWSASTTFSFGSGPDVASDGTGSWVAVWSTGPSGNRNISVARSVDGALTWTVPATLNTDHATDGRDDAAPRVAAGGAGTYVVVWERLGSATNPTSGLHMDALTANSSDGGLTWSAPAPLNPGAAAAGEDAVYDLQPQVARDPAGYFFAYWASKDPAIASGTKGPDFDMVMALAGHPCGNGILDPAEVCDDGDRGSLDCCGRTCTFDPAGTPCAADADLCTLERCDGTGTCDHPNAPAGTPCDPDADLCTFDRCDGNDVCEHVYEPHTGCLQPVSAHGSTFRFAGGGDPARQKLKWTWTHGPATTVADFAVFLPATHYELCVYDPTGLVARAAIPAGGTCRDRPCWSFVGYDGARYVDRDGTSNGVTSAVFKAGGAGKTKVKVAAKGSNLALPSLPVAAVPLHPQLVGYNGFSDVCVDAPYSAAGVKANTGSAFTAKSD